MKFLVSSKENFSNTATSIIIQEGAQTILHTELFGGCKIRIGNKQGGGLKPGINEVSSTVSNELWRQKGCYDTWNGQPFTI